MRDVGSCRRLPVSSLSTAKLRDNVPCSVRPSIHQSMLSRLNHVTFDLDFCHGGRP